MSALLERRRERIEALHDKLEKYEGIANAEIRKRLKDVAIDYETKADREYAACARAFLC